jgi:lysophospholipase L1-like esterase
MSFGKLGAMGRGMGHLGALGRARFPSAIAAGGPLLAIGDSIVYRNSDPSANLSLTGEISNSAKGALTAARMRDPRFDFYVYYLNGGNPGNRGGPNKGVSGDTAAQVLARITNITNQNPVLPPGFYYAAGTNDIRDAADRTAAAIFADMVSAIDAVRAKWPTIPVIFSTIRATADVSLGLTYGITAAQLTKMQDVNALIRSYCAANASWCLLCDAYYAYALESGYGDPTLLEDGLHPTVHGTGIEVVNYLLPATQRMFLPGTSVETGTNLFPFDLSVSGGSTANGVSGTVPSGMLVTGTVAAPPTTCVSSLVTEGGIPKVRLDFTPSGSSVYQFRFTSAGNVFSTITVPNNAWLKFIVDAETDPNNPIVGAQAEFYITNTTTARSVGGKFSPTVGFAPKQYQGSFTLTTEAFQASGTSISVLFRMLVGIDGSRAGSPWIKWSNPRFISVSDPASK